VNILVGAVLIMLLLGTSYASTTSGLSIDDHQSFVNGDQVLLRIYGYSTALGNRSAQAAGSRYASGALTDWSGVSSWLASGGQSVLGTFVGQHNITSHLASFVESTSSPWFVRMSKVTVVPGADSVNSSFDFSFFGINEGGLVFNSTALVQQEWERTPQLGWSIQSEKWDFLNYALVLTTGSAWTHGQDYPAIVQGQSCTNLEDNSTGSAQSETNFAQPNILSGDYVLCVGGTLVSQPSAAPPSYFVQIPSPLGGDLGPWNSTTSYPVPGAHPSCVAFVQAIFCVGGSPSNVTSAVFAAPISLAGLGAWQNVGAYPLAISDTSCVLRPFDQEFVNPYMVCVGGREQNGTDTSAVYGAHVYPGNSRASPTIGPWSALSAPYPTPIQDTSCVYSYGIYCIGGMVDGSPISAAFTVNDMFVDNTNWVQYASYPFRVAGESCAVGGMQNSIYCVGGEGMQGSGGAAVFYTNRISGVWNEANWFEGQPFLGEISRDNCFFGAVENMTLYCVSGSQLGYEQVLGNRTQT
jgi:hypothetical protein